MKKKAKGARPYLGRILVLAIYLALWTLAYRLVGQDILLASPLQVVRVLGQLVVKGEFWQSVANSLLRILLGFVLAVLAVFSNTLLIRFCFRSSACLLVFLCFERKSNKLPSH